MYGDEMWIFRTFSFEPCSIGVAMQIVVPAE